MISWFENKTQKRWTPDDIRKYMGDVKQTHLSYSFDDSLRQCSASGGSVTALLLHLLESDQIDGALVNEIYIEAGIVKNRFFIAQNREILIRSQGSKYQTVRFTSQAIPLIQSFNGRLAIVALPCDASILRSICEKDPEINKKVTFLISLFCGHNTTPELTNNIIKTLTKDQTSELINFQYRSGKWRGEIGLEFADGSKIHVPFSRFGDYQNLYFFCERKCLNCHDHFGYFGDISAGDIWLQSMIEHEIKPTALLARTERGLELIRSALNAGSLALEPCSDEIILHGQARTLKSHYQVSARSKVGKLFGLKIPDNVNENVHALDLIIAFIIILNYKFSNTPFGKRIIFSFPRLIWKIYLYIFKGLESL